MIPVWKRSPLSIVSIEGESSEELFLKFTNLYPLLLRAYGILNKTEVGICNLEELSAVIEMFCFWWLLRTWNMTGTTKKLKFKFHLIE